MCVYSVRRHITFRDLALLGCGAVSLVFLVVPHDSQEPSGFIFKGQEVFLDFVMLVAASQGQVNQNPTQNTHHSGGGVQQYYNNKGQRSWCKKCDKRRQLSVHFVRQTNPGRGNITVPSKTAGLNYSPRLGDTGDDAVASN